MSVAASPSITSARAEGGYFIGYLIASVVSTTSTPYQILRVVDISRDPVYVVDLESQATLNHGYQFEQSAYLYGYFESSKLKFTALKYRYMSSTPVSDYQPVQVSYQLDRDTCLR